MTEVNKIISRVELNLHPMDGAGVSNLRCTVGVKNAEAIIRALMAEGFAIVAYRHGVTHSPDCRELYNEPCSCGVTQNGGPANA